ncbi:DUF1214 domain-containing protein [Aureimonas leprariae]|uniref:DUF1214 domain-containing protein n=1 Tax=Plantimonas leprariae TaxID=2615207 RepID=A0A7V7TWU2_9HYPH|nr:DUF1214 domain-containing protein [Aureimonas leprariae]KAB0679960.1 DUF1214 domain-containing protein [Aureimonas leprariae]
MRSLILLLAAVAIALGLGGWSARRALGSGAGSSSIAIGVWRADPLAGSADASPYEKARLSQIGDLTLGIGEGIQFKTFTDGSGAPLRRECSYELSGGLPLARVWTLAAFTPDGRLVQPGDGRPGWLVSRNLLRREDNVVVVAASAEARPGNWLALSGTGSFALVLTLYDTPASTSSGVGGVELLKVERKACTGV